VPTTVQDYITSLASLTPRKIATICVFTREMLERSTPNIEALLRMALSESLGLALDNTLFSAAAGDAATPTGIFNGIAPLAASTQTIASEAMTEDGDLVS
jgi:HK97 family phage major capsid protein